MDNENLKLLYQESMNELNTFSAQMNDIRKLCYNNTNSYGVDNKTTGERTDLYCYNSRVPTSVTQFAATMVSIVAPIGTKFFDIGTNDKIDEKSMQEFTKNSADVSQTIFLKLNNSNYYQALHESMLDIASGTGGYIINFDNNKKELNFKSLDLSTVGFLEDENGIVNYVFRNLGDFNKSKRLRLYPNLDFGDADILSLVEIVYPSNNEFVHIITDKNLKNIYSEVKWKTNPFIIYRWGKLSNENRGRGPLNNILGAVKLANTMFGDIITASAKIIDPPYLVSDNGLMNPNNLRIEPGALITLRDNMSRFEPLSQGGNLPFAFQEVNMINAEIDNALMINRLGQVGNATLTATEVNARMQNDLQVLGSAYGRMQRELLNSTFDRIIELFEKFDVIQPLTNSVDMNGNIKSRKVTFKYNSPLIHTQNQNEVQKLLQSIQALANATGQEAQEYINAGYKINKLPNWFAKNIGVDMSLVNTDEEVNNNLDEFAKAKAAQQIAQINMSNPALGSQPVNTGVIQ